MLGGPAAWAALLPAGVRQVAAAEALADGVWELLAVTREALAQLETCPARCRILLVPGDCPPELPARLGAETVVTYGLSHRDSLTLSSLREPVLCVQRTLPRPDGGVVEPQEFPLPRLPGPAELLLPLLGLRLLQIPQTQPPFSW